ncbi:hypothetical protein SAMN04487944_107110 [Gracilibacillus ureilyticus]|uniref:Uncharacterized protein n=1 Tax=Gracilibacillus ureilyticus TaxID=531814 RepID=A0A1H9QUN5_9BACI|nr:hypothetical protein [Gracilibacillus ureilyticus]SER64168.1 hypothetical protein SAMN04487944_107110 [Gracilibacillus ureilyticus]
MFLFEQEAQIGDDRQDLLEILRMRFGAIPPSLEEQLYQLQDYATLERLILVAANAPTLQVFIEEVNEGNDSFKIVGDRFNPLQQLYEKGDKDEK